MKVTRDHLNLAWRTVKVTGDRKKVTRGRIRSRSEDSESDARSLLSDARSDESHIEDSESDLWSLWECSSIVGFAAVADVDDVDDALLVIDRVDDAPIADADPPSNGLALQLLHA
jgi:hypothetical protein